MITEKSPNSVMNSVSKTKSFLLALIIITGLIFLNLPSVSGKIKNFLYSISSPIQKSFDNFTQQIKQSWDFLNSLNEISKENTRLEEKIKELTVQNTELKEFEKENELLRSYLNLPKYQRYQIDLANVVGRDFQGLEKYILINKGGLAGVKKDLPIIAFENILIGKIYEVFENFSKVLLITSSNSKIPALIQESRVEGLIKGSGGNILFMDLVSKDVKVEENQTIITSGIGGDFPKGILIGKISEIESAENKMFQKIEVEPAIKTEKIEKVFIITK